MKIQIKTYIIGILIPLFTGGLSALLTMKNMNIYKSIIRPALSPPAILFPIAWTILYTIMGVGSVLIYNKRNQYPKDSRQALIIYGFQLFINFIWSIVFFNLEAYLLSFILLVVLWVLVFTMVLKFLDISPLAAVLQIPYLLWLTFAGYLSLSIYLLNGG